MYLHVMSILENRRIEIIIVAKISQNYLHKQSFLKGTQCRIREVGLFVVGDEQVIGEVGERGMIIQLEGGIIQRVKSKWVLREEVGGRGSGGSRGRVGQEWSWSGRGGNRRRNHGSQVICKKFAGDSG